MFTTRRFIKLEWWYLCSNILPLKANTNILVRSLSTQHSFVTKELLDSSVKPRRSVFDIDKAELAAFVNGWDNDLDNFEDLEEEQMLQNQVGALESVTYNQQRSHSRLKCKKSGQMGFEIEHRQYETQNDHNGYFEYKAVEKDKPVTTNTGSEGIEFKKNAEFEDSNELVSNIECNEKLIFENDGENPRFAENITSSNLQKLSHDLSEIDEKLEFGNILPVKQANEYNIQFETEANDLGDYISGLTYSRWAQNLSSDKKVILEEIDLEYVEQRTFSRLLQKMNSNPHRLTSDLYIDENVTIGQFQKDKQQLERIAREQRSNTNRVDLPTFQADVDEKLLYLDNFGGSSERSRKSARRYDSKKYEYRQEQRDKYTAFETAILKIQSSKPDQSTHTSVQISEQENPRYTDNKIADYCDYCDYCDFKRIYIAGGDGGDGCVSFLKAKRCRKGMADGGNGGQGGSVYFEATKDLVSLSSVSLKVHGQRGSSGKAKQQDGKSGVDVTIRVPVGTVIREVELPARNEELSRPNDDYFVHYPGWKNKNLNSAFTAVVKPIPLPRQKIHELDLKVDGQKHLLCYGGLGGFGNPYFVNSLNKYPKFATKGQRGQARLVELELKTISDAGLIGLPNAGKSSFLRSVSNAYPKVDSYPFTTINPCVGTVQYPDSFSLTITDIPGLVEGAHKNVGLGHLLLRHIERSSVLVYVIDLTRNAPWDDLSLLRNELELYKPGLSKRPSLIIANKSDISNVAKSNFEHFRSIAEHQIVPISAKPQKNIKKAATVLREMIENCKR